MTLERRDWAGLVIALAVAAGCVRLGVWQLDRLGQRRERNAAVRAARARPPLEVTGSVAADTARDRQLHARGRYDYSYEQLWHGRSYDGVPGVDLITPLRLADGSAVLVDRGWAPSPDGYHVDQRAYREGDSGDVRGLGRLGPAGRGDVAPIELRNAIPYRLLPFVLQQVPSDSPSVWARPATLRRWGVPPLSDGPHLSYAIQWFSFAVIIVVGAAALWRQRRREGAPAPDGAPRGTNNTLS